MKQNTLFIKLSIILLLVTILVAIAGNPYRASQAQELTSVIVQGESPAQVAAAIRQFGGRVTQELTLIHSVVAHIPAAAIKELEAHPAVQRVWLNSSVSKANALEGGELLWTVTTNATVNTPPVTGPDETLILADKNHTVYAYAPDGSLQWTYDTAGDLTSEPALGSDGTVYIGDKDGYLYALDPAGQLRWQYDAGKAIKKTVAVSADAIAFVSKKHLYLLDHAGNLLDSFRAQKTIRTAPAFGIDGDVVYFGDNGHNFYAYSLTNGLAWQNHKGELYFELAPTPGPDNSVYVVGDAGRVDWIWAADAAGAELWSFQSQGEIQSQPTIGPDNNLYFADTKGTIYVLDNNGTLLWTIENKNAVKTGVQAAADGTTFAAVKKTLYAFAPDGRVLFEFEAAGRIKAGPVLSANESTIYFTDHKKNLYAIHTGINQANQQTPDTAYPRVAGASDVWVQGITGAGVGVAVVDTGIAPLEGLLYNANGEVRLTGWVDFVDGSPHPIDPSGHGTHVAGIIANSELTEYGDYAGIASNANLIGVRILDETGTGTYATAIAGLDWVVNNKDAYNIRVVNMSLTAPPQSHYWDDPLNQAVMATWAADIVVVTAAGNQGPNPLSITVPGNVPYVITVGAFTDNYTPDDFDDDFLAPFSAAGPTWDGFVKPDVIAPGAHMVSLMPADSYLAQAYPDKQVAENYFQMAGTSAAAPVVAGLSALMLEADPSLTPDQVKYRIMNTALTAGTDSDNDGELDLMVPSLWQQGSGRVWAPEAVFTNMLGKANNGLNIDLDLAGTEHYLGFTQYFTDTEHFYLNGSGDWVWSGGDWVWSGNPNTIWDGGDWVWSGGDWVWSGGDWVWSGGDWVWSGGLDQAAVNLGIWIIE